MTMVNEYRIRSGLEMVTEEVPDVPYRVQGLLRVNGGRMSLTGQAKKRKSFLAQDLAMRLAKGDDWLGFKTTPGNVLYVNLEISEEKFQERTQDISDALQYRASDLSGFRTVTVLDRNLALDDSPDVLQKILDESRGNGFAVDTVVIDPRARAVVRREIDEDVIKAMCDNIDLLIGGNPGLSVVIVTHMGKDATRGPIGHSRFIGWLDTNIELVEKRNVACGKVLEITGRDTEDMEIGLEFKYPLHRVVPIEAKQRRGKIDGAAVFLQVQLAGGDMTEQELKRLARAGGHTSYAIEGAISELRDAGIVVSEKASGQGNRKRLRLATK
jgi:hypothetical protein